MAINHTIITTNDPFRLVRDDEEIELINEVSVSKLAVGDKVQVGKDIWAVTHVTSYNVVLLTSSGYYCTLNQKSVLDWVSIS